MAAAIFKGVSGTASASGDFLPNTFGHQVMTLWKLSWRTAKAYLQISVTLKV